MDGWPLVTAANSPSSVHLWELVKAGEEAGAEMKLALPAFVDPMPAEAIVRHCAFTSWGRMMWEQKVLPELARQTGANLLHSVTGSLPLSSPVPCVYSPTGPVDSAGDGIMAHLRASIGRGGFSRAQAILWPEDLPVPEDVIPIVKLPPHAHPVFSIKEFRLHFDLPDEYIFCLGPVAENALDQLAAAWSWVSAGLGEDWALVVDGISAQTAACIRERSGSEARVVPVQAVTVGTRAGLMQKAAVVLLVGQPIPWGDPLLEALLCERPVAAEETQWNAMRAGPAAYLTPPGDTRMLGAAALTLIVEDPVAEGLVLAAHQRAETLRAGDFPTRLLEAYRQILS